MAAHDDLLNAAVGVQAVMAASYTARQAVEMCMTAQHNPGVPVAFDTEDSGTAVVIFQEGLGWAVVAE